MFVVGKGNCHDRIRRHNGQKAGLQRWTHRAEANLLRLFALGFCAKEPNVIDGPAEDGTGCGTNRLHDGIFKLRMPGG
jgi:hypothetical protein